MNYEKYECKLCGKVFTGEYSKARAEECEHGHDVITISIMDYELPGLINYFNTHDRAFLPKGFLKKLRNLQGRVLRG
jgi:hypothetical protein